ncbi:hypothetical protein FGO68_gene16069 [Halteria grandinella]|uniref:Uncharacterized protein n=1 Tax=Halteria grandinella TaxID=5974 RepID=A0A8J8T3P4_HALGN|nr:hypothetical protein FGO68_gene16069 [Halteria grandinella]
MPLLYRYSFRFIFLPRYLPYFSSICCFRKAAVSWLTFLLFSVTLFSSCSELSLSTSHILACSSLFIFSIRSWRFLSSICWNRNSFVLSLISLYLWSLLSASLLSASSLCCSHLLILWSSSAALASCSLITVSAMWFMNSYYLSSLALISLILSCSCFSSIWAQACCALMSSSFSRSRSSSSFAFNRLFSISIFYRYSFSCDFLAICILISSSLSFLSRSLSLSCSSSASLCALRFLSFSSFSCLSLLACYSASLSWMRRCFSCSCSSRNFICSTYCFMYNSFSSISRYLLIFLSASQRSSSSFIRRLRSRARDSASFCSSQCKRVLNLTIAFHSSSLGCPLLAMWESVSKSSFLSMPRQEEAIERVRLYYWLFEEAEIETRSLLLPSTPFLMDGMLLVWDRRSFIRLSSYRKPALAVLAAQTSNGCSDLLSSRIISLFSLLKASFLILRSSWRRLFSVSLSFVRNLFTSLSMQRIRFGRFSARLSNRELLLIYLFLNLLISSPLSISRL